MPVSDGKGSPRCLQRLSTYLSIDGPMLLERARILLTQSKLGCSLPAAVEIGEGRWKRPTAAFTQAMGWGRDKGTWYERVFRYTFPAFQTQVRFAIETTQEQGVRVVDFCEEARGLIVELDGPSHRGRRQREADDRFGTAAANSGIAVLRIDNTLIEACVLRNIEDWMMDNCGARSWLDAPIEDLLHCRLLESSIMAEHPVTEGMTCYRLPTNTWLPWIRDNSYLRRAIRVVVEES